MNRRQLRESYYEASGTVSEITRQLCFAGIAIIWMFKTQGSESAGIKFTMDLLLPLWGFTASLSCDLFHYVYKTILFGIYNRLYEVKNVSEKANFKAPIVINWPTLLFFWAKVMFAILSYISLLKYVGGNLI